ncbi:nidogen-like domain-containing protein [Rhodanobacter sp. AS-Z3]|uniref:nidogen-like domain-containing protein n=1 Tax=Rhodanobacter sp. AS-Z3 TaxID=3031330 RepID=UPI0024788799|nr:nidogen-like domain-containing protein [Rhodanobacter sp. AS-Z3]WEN16198.1 nidogen-like domain-containing protein [Rhodanobacter sp. AS-Z3]
MSTKFVSKNRWLMLAAIAFAVVVMPAAQAGTVATGFDTNTLAANDDGYTSAVNLGFSVNFFGNSYSSLFVNNNGNVTFQSGLYNYTPYGLGSGYTGVQPIIAPFFADVDTRASGSGLTSYGNGTYAGNQAFGVTWPGVGYFNSNADKLNTFQLIIVNRSDITAGDFDFYFNYDQIQWETGSASGGSNGLGGTSAAAGYNAGQGNLAGTYGQFSGSLTNGALLDGGPNSLVAGTNDGVVGQYLFQVRNGTVTPPTSVPEPSSLAMLALGLFGLFGLGILRRKQNGFQA